LGIVAHRNAAALSGFLVAQGHRWLKGVNVVVSDGSGSYRSAIAQHLGHATHESPWISWRLLRLETRMQS
ncbi:MAG TPA: hypothetical protein VK070_07935, partial [Acidimicrobiia bacterium]|nr:hypothetical protein [Acidimicrobiia bacterium]